MNINSKQKELIKVYAVIFAVIAVVMNWNSVSWIFNYRALSGFIHDIVYAPGGGKAAAASNVASNSASLSVNAQKDSYVRPNSMEIASLNIAAPIVWGRTTDVTALTKDLDRGAVIYPGSVDPGKNGQTIILGHSAPPGWPRIKHDWIFSDLNNLKAHDEIAIYLDNARYTYRVTGKKIIKRGENLAEGGPNNKNMLTLLTCWPPGKDQDRLAVSAEYVPGK